MTVRRAVVGAALAVALVGSGATIVVLRSQHHAAPTRASASSPTTAGAIPGGGSTRPPDPSTSASTVPPAAPAATGGWQPVAQAPGLDELTLPRGTVIRMDPHQLDVALVPGTAEPGGAFPEGGAVPPAKRASLVAATNAGFKRADARGGELVDGQTIGALAASAASLVIHADGTIDVGSWGSTVGPSPNNVAVLQNLTLLVDGGKPAADLGRNILQRWGVSFRPQLPVSIWRSGTGVDAQGRLLFALGPNLLPADLAQLLVAAGAVRAMELDINHMWVFADVFVHPDPRQPDVVQAQPILPGMTPKPEHVLAPGARDFLAVYRRQP